MPKKFSQEQVDTLDEMLRRGMLQGGRAKVAQEIVRRSRSGETGGRREKLARIAEARNSGTGAFMDNFADTATFGLAGRAVDMVNAGARKAGVPAMTREERTAMDEQQAEEHPVAATAGTVSGAFAGGAGAGGVAARAGLRPARTFRGRLAQYGTAGGGAGAAEQVIREGEVSGNTAASGAVGAVTGAGGGGLVEKVLPVVAPVVSRAWRKLAAKLQTPVDDMAAFIEDTRRATGQMPSVGQAIHARDQGLLQGWAARHNTFGTAMDDAAHAAPGQDLSAGRLRKTRSDRFEEAMGSPRQANPDNLPDGGLPPTVRDSRVTLSEELLESPHVHDAMRGPKMKDIRIKIAEGESLTVGDIDRIRLKLRNMQKQEPGGPFGDFADQLRDDAAAQVPEYGEALEQYARQSKFIEGFEKGHSGRALSEVEDVITTREGTAGLDAGARTRQGQRTLRTMAPSVPMATSDFPGLEEVGRGAAHMAVGGKALGTFHVLRGMMDMLPEAYQREIAAGLLTRDPVKIQATLAQLRKAGADLQDIRRLAGGLSTMIGANVSEAAGDEGAPR